MNDQLEQAVNAIIQGQVIAYPTEAVYGLGCDPFNEQAVRHLLHLKQRPVEKGLILIAYDWQQVADLTTAIEQACLQNIFATWPGANTWIFPASSKAPSWITGQFSGIALRISAHPLCRELCQRLGGPLVSTSANPGGEPPALSAVAVDAYFPKQLGYVLDGELGGNKTVSVIRDALSGELIRA